MHTMTDAEKSKFGERLAVIFSLRKSTEHPDRYVLGDGHLTKTALGVFETFADVARKIHNKEEI